jgi:hypothetical protein
MAKLYHNGSSLLGLRKTSAEESLYPIPNGVSVIEFDNDTNASVLQGLNTEWNSHSIVGGQLHRNGSPVTINADSTKTTSRKDFDSVVDAYITDLQTYLTIADSATNAQVRAQTKLLTQGMIRVVRILKQLRELQKD